jgi:hypothetical protein
MDDKQYYDEKLAEIPKEFLDKVVNFVKEDFGKDPEMIEEIKAAYEEQGPIQWAIPAHHDWGMHIRNTFRNQGFTEDNLPDGNWDDYYIQVIELALGLRK